MLNNQPDIRNLFEILNLRLNFFIKQWRVRYLITYTYDFGVALFITVFNILSLLIKNEMKRKSLKRKNVVHLTVSNAA